MTYLSCAIFSRRPISHISATDTPFFSLGIEVLCGASLRLAGDITAHIISAGCPPKKKASLMVVGEHGMMITRGRFESVRLTRYAYQLGQVRGTNPEDIAARILFR